jgi:hypothetical protein
MIETTLQRIGQSRFGSKIPTEWLPTVLALIIAFFLLLWGITPWLDHQHSLRFRMPKLSGASATLSQQAMPIESHHVFGLYVQDYAHLPITTLPLTLQGTMINPAQSALSSAIISVDNGNAKPYHIHDNLSVGATIVAIHNSYCVLDHSGRLEKLILPHQTLQNSPPLSGLSLGSGLQVIK